MLVAYGCSENWHSEGAQMFVAAGFIRVPPDPMIERVAAWVEAGGRSLNKPTHFQARDGRF